MGTKRIISNTVDKLINAFPIVWMEKHIVDPDDKDKKIKFRPFQEDFIRDCFDGLTRWIAYNLGRQSGKTIALLAVALYKAVVLNRQVVIITPQEGNLLTVWNKLEFSISNSPYISSQLTKTLGKPYKIKIFKGGGSIKGVITGINIDKPAVSSRGISGTDLIVDEAAYIPECAWGVILPFMINSPKGTLVMTSTPSEFDGFFYQAFHDPSLGFKLKTLSTPEANDRWSPEIERLFRAQFPGPMYDREILAKFPTTAGGVFPEDSINMAMMNYEYTEVPWPGYRYVMGVDWNTPENGCQIALIAFNGSEYVVTHRTSIDNVHNVQLAAVDEIIRLNNIFKPEYIFPDTGYGHTQIELLNQHGLLHPSSGLQTKVKGIDFNSDDTVKVKVGEDILKKKPKAFMVALTQGLIQSGQLKFSSHDKDGDHSLYNQFRKFRVKRQGFGMVPVFSDGYFHGLLAIMTAILGIYKYYSQYSMDYASTDGFFVSFDKINAFSLQKRNVNVPTDAIYDSPDKIRARDPNYLKFMGIKSKETQAHDLHRKAIGDNGSPVINRSPFGRNNI